jgi:hypothetical protein
LDRCRVRTVTLRADPICVVSWEAKKFPKSSKVGQ